MDRGCTEPAQSRRLDESYACVPSGWLLYRLLHPVRYGWMDRNIGFIGRCSHVMNERHHPNPCGATSPSPLLLECVAGRFLVFYSTPVAVAAARGIDGLWILVVLHHLLLCSLVANSDINSPGSMGLSPSCHTSSWWGHNSSHDRPPSLVATTIAR